MWVAAFVGLSIWAWYQMDYRSRNMVAEALWALLFYAAAFGSVVMSLSTLCP